MSLKPCHLATFSWPYTLYSLPLLTGSHRSKSWPWAFNDGLVSTSNAWLLFLFWNWSFVCLFVSLTKFSWNPFWEAVTAPDFQCFVLFPFLSERQTRSLGKEVYVLPWQRKKAQSHVSSLYKRQQHLPASWGQLPHCFLTTKSRLCIFWVLLKQKPTSGTKFSGVRMR